MLLPCGGFTKAGQIPVLIFSLSPVSSSHTMFYSTAQECVIVGRWLASLWAQGISRCIWVWHLGRGEVWLVCATHLHKHSCRRKWECHLPKKTCIQASGYRLLQIQVLLACCLWEPLVYSSMSFSPSRTLDIARGCGSHLVLRAMSASQKRCSHSHFHTETFLPLLLVTVITSLLQCQQSSIRHHY